LPVKLKVLPLIPNEALIFGGPYAYVVALFWKPGDRDGLALRGIVRVVVDPVCATTSTPGSFTTIATIAVSWPFAAQIPAVLRRKILFFAFTKGQGNRIIILRWFRRCLEALRFPSMLKFENSLNGAFLFEVYTLSETFPADWLECFAVSSLSTSFGKQHFITFVVIKTSPFAPVRKVPPFGCTYSASSLGLQAFCSIRHQIGTKWALRFSTLTSGISMSAAHRAAAFRHGTGFSPSPIPFFQRLCNWYPLAFL
jgi:hypothetical protein